MKVVVTGGNGFIAKHLIKKLLSNNHEVTVISRSINNRPDQSVNWIKQDYNETSKLASIFQSKDVIFHLASSLRHYPQHQIVKVNQELTSTIVKACNQCSTPPKFIFVSSQAAGGPSSRGIPRSEIEQDKPVSFYGKSKLESEYEVKRLESWWTIQRPPAVFGSHEKDILNYINMIRKGFEFHIGNEQRLFSWVYVNDVVTTLVESVRFDALDKKVWYIRSGDTNWNEFAVTIRDILENRNLYKFVIPVYSVKMLGHIFTLLELIIKKPLLLNKDKINELLHNDWRCDDTFFRQTTNWVSIYSLKDALTETITWIQKENSNDQ